MGTSTQRPDVRQQPRCKQRTLSVRGRPRDGPEISYARQQSNRRHQRHQQRLRRLRYTADHSGTSIGLLPSTATPSPSTPLFSNSPAVASSQKPEPTTAANYED